jgi:hypothetical protein
MDSSPDSRRRNVRRRKRLVEVISGQDLWRLTRSSTRRRLQVTPRKRESSVSIAERRVIMRENTVVKRRNAPSNRYV